MFEVGDFAICPGHGVGQICRIDERSIGEELQSFYVLKLTSNGMTVMIPLENKEGIRKLANES